MKKRLAIFTILMCVVLLAGCGSATAAVDPFDYATAGINWRQFEGTEINVLLNQHYCADVILNNLDQFVELTGIRPNIEILAEDDFFAKLVVVLSSSAAPDAFMLNYTYRAQYLEMDALQPLGPYLDDPALTNKEWFMFDDFLSSAIDCGSDTEGNLYGFPISGEWQVLFYRKDLYEQHGLKVPETFDELLENAKILKTDEMSGYAARMARFSGLWWPFGGVCVTSGAYWINPDGTTNLNDPAVKKAAEMYVKLVQEAGPQGVLNYTWYEISQDFLNGKTAHILDSSGFMATFEDIENSAVAGKVGYALIPAFEQGGKRAASLNHWMLGVSKNARNKEAGYLFSQWATAMEMSRIFAVDGGQITRESMWTDPGVVSKYSAEWIKAQQESIPLADSYTLPNVIEAAETGDILTIAINDLYEGGNIDEIFTDAHNKFFSLLGK